MELEKYALIGDTQSAALVSTEGSIDWLCLPRFDSGALFSALLGTPDHGRWKIAPVEPVKRLRRRYRRDTLVLETEFTTASGVVRLLDCMPPRSGPPELVRVIEGVRGQVPMRMDLTVRFDYGAIVPWVTQKDGRLMLEAGPDALVLTTDLETWGEGLSTVSEFMAGPEKSDALTLSWYPSHLPPPPALDARQALRDTLSFWRQWVSLCRYEGPWREAVVRSLIVLKALTYAPTGGIVAAPTTSVPELLGGERNWDYRYCWVRDASFTLDNLYRAGYREEARAWRKWLIRTAAGAPSQLQMLYGVSGERRIPELELGWLPGYEGSRPVRVGNGAASQLQLDVYGELMDTMYRARVVEGVVDRAAWRIERALMDFLEAHWADPDEGIWEVRCARQPFVFSKVMAWVAVDRAIRSAEQFQLEAPLERWRRLREAIRGAVLEKGVDRERQCFTQSFGSKVLDASLLRIPLVGFLPANDPLVVGTVKAIERELVRDGLVLRYDTSCTPDGLFGAEGAFLACSFWLADDLVALGREDEARALFERLLKLRNDVGLLAEEYDLGQSRMVGNFPQAFSHLALVNTAFNLAGARELGRAAKSDAAESIELQ
ncbi:MAG: glycoside hydrolase family 15 protein [Deltaproteobacteria bacterium]|nr:glycoside hydrolase family 15 protein [Deltaproteobacteria bacterium]